MDLQHGLGIYGIGKDTLLIKFDFIGVGLDYSNLAPLIYNKHLHKAMDIYANECIMKLDLFS